MTRTYRSRSRSRRAGGTPATCVTGMRPVAGSILEANRRSRSGNRSTINRVSPRLRVIEHTFQFFQPRFWPRAEGRCGRWSTFGTSSAEHGRRKGRIILGGTWRMEARVQTGMQDSELDMMRQRVRVHPGKVRRIFTSLVTFQSSNMLQTPRRAIDRETQQYSPLCERV